MDFMNRGNRPVQQNAQPADQQRGPAHAAPAASVAPKENKLVKFGYVGFVAVVALLIVAIILSLVFVKRGGSAANEFSKVDTSKLQAVFLNGGQVYFGDISGISSKNLTLDNIYYLRVNQQVQPDQANANNAAASSDDISLVKLGCELHGPEDSMVINRDQIIFWENLKNDGQVAKAVAQYIKDNPNGQKCEQPQDTSTGTPGTTNP
jgi:hypothetical protein